MEDIFHIVEILSPLVALFAFFMAELIRRILRYLVSLHTKQSAFEEKLVAFEAELQTKRESVEEVPSAPVEDTSDIDQALSERGF